MTRWGWSRSAERKRRTAASSSRFWGKTEFQLELTWLRDHPQKYDLGECEFHLALAVEDMEKAHALHEKLGCICYENPAMGIYFISDPDGYWFEIIPTK